MRGHRPSLSSCCRQSPSGVAVLSTGGTDLPRAEPELCLGTHSTCSIHHLFLLILLCLQCRWSWTTQPFRHRTEKQACTGAVWTCSCLHSQGETGKEPTSLTFYYAGLRNLPLEQWLHGQKLTKDPCFCCVLGYSLGHGARVVRQLPDPLSWEHKLMRSVCPAASPWEDVPCLPDFVDVFDNRSQIPTLQQE